MAKRRWHRGGDLSPVLWGKLGKTPQPCSCEACRNPRHSFLNKGQLRLTLDERRFLAEPIDED